MRGMGGLVWAVMVMALLVGVFALVGSRFMQPQSTYLNQAVGVARTIDSQAKSHLEDLGVRFAPKGGSVEPTLNMDQPSDADFAFLFSILESNDDKARVSAAKVLRDIGDIRAVKPLRKAIRGIEPTDVFFLQCALTIIDGATPDQRIAALIPMWQDKNTLTEDMRVAVRLKLRDAGALDQGFLEEAAVTAGDTDTRRFAITELGALPKPPGGVLAAAMADPDLETRELAQTTFLLAARKRGEAGATKTP